MVAFIQIKLQTYDLMSPHPFISVSDIKSGGWVGVCGMSPEQSLPFEAFTASSMKSSILFVIQYSTAEQIICECCLALYWTKNKGL